MLFARRHALSALKKALAGQNDLVRSCWSFLKGSAGGSIWDSFVEVTFFLFSGTPKEQPAFLAGSHYYFGV